MEEWRQSAYAAYEVSDLGRVRRSKPGRGTRAGYVLAQCDTGHGYLGINVRQGQINRSVKVHSLVAQAFLGPRPDGYTIDHLDGDKSNNTPGNLQYVPQAVNVQRHYSSPRGQQTRDRIRAYSLSPEGREAKRRAGSKGGGSNRNPITSAEVALLAAQGMSLTQMADRLQVGVKVIRNRLRESAGLAVYGKRAA